MKTFRITALALVMVCSFPLLAQSQIGDVRITKPKIDKVDELVTVEFTATIGKKAVKRNYSTVFAPSITDGTYTWSLDPIIVSGRGGRVSLDRQILATGNSIVFDNATFARNGQTVHYTASAPYQEWMEGAQLTMQAVSVGCCSQSTLASHTMAEEMKLQPTMEEYVAIVAERHQPVEVPQPVTVIERGPVTTGEKLAESFTFIIPSTEFRPIEPGGMYVEEREGTIQIRYPVGSSTVIRSFADNEKSLSDLMAAIRVLEDSRDSRVKAVTIAGFASPEGSFEVNDRLAWNRAVSMKEYILSHSSLGADQVILYNGSVDWQGLRMLIEESDVSWKQRALDIIDNTPVWDTNRNVGRHGELMRLDGGNPYRYMKQHMFGKLRSSAYIYLFFENVTEE